MTGGDFVKVESVSKSFGDNRVLTNVSLDVGAHDVVCLIGASGSGKSTLLRCINLLENVDAGSISVDGQDLTGGKIDVNKLRQQIGIVFQAYNLFPHMTVLQNVTLSPRKTRGLSRKEAEERAYELSTASACATRPRSSPTASRAASSSASRSCGRSRWIPS